MVEGLYTDQGDPLISGDPDTFGVMSNSMDM
jgi:hypothetical protein